MIGHFVKVMEEGEVGNAAEGTEAALRADHFE